MKTIGWEENNEVCFPPTIILSRQPIGQCRVSIVHNNCYWEIGKLLFECKSDSTHGSVVVKRLSADLKKRFPDMCNIAT